MSLRFSVIIPCYNHGEYVEEAVASTGLYERNDTEVIIIDDGSNDETVAVLSGLEHSRLKLIRQENKGVAAARNVGIAEVSGEYVLLLDADNTVNPKYLDAAAAILDEKEEVAVVYSNPILLQQDGQELESSLPQLSAERLLSGNFIDTCAVVRAKLFDAIGLFDENPDLQGFEDWEFWIRAYFSEQGFQHIPEPLFKYRIAESSLRTFANQRKERKKRVALLLAKYRGPYEKHVAGVVITYLEFLMHNEHEVTRLKQELTTTTDELNIQLSRSLESVFKLQTRINALEDSKLFKLQRQLRHVKNLFRSNSEANGSRSYLKMLIFFFSKKGLQVLRKFSSKILKHLYIWVEDKPVYIVESPTQSGQGLVDPYNHWLSTHIPSQGQLLDQQLECRKMTNTPLVSIVVPVYNAQPDHLKAAVESLKKQTYSNWELCLADDRSTNSDVAETIHALRVEEPRIKVVFRETNGHISQASNSALELATGEFCLLMDQDDLLTADALYRIVKVIQEKPATDIVYSDEDKVDDHGVHSYPHFKPDWSPDNLLSRNYLGHVTVIRTALLREVGGWRVGFEGSQDYDLMLRLTEKTDHIEHIPRILYHWRIHAASAAAGEEAKPYAYSAAKKALEEALVRRAQPGKVDFLDGFRGYSIRYDLKSPEARVSIIIPTKDKTELLRSCVESIFTRSSHKNFEVVVVDNGSTEKEFFEYMDECKKSYGSSFKHCIADIPFNFSKLVNTGVKHSSGDYVILLNNDTEVITPDWIEGMQEQAQRPSVGVVGVKLLYPNDTIQHAGVIMGLGGAAGHVLVGEDRHGPGYFNYVNLLNNYSAVTAACVMVRRTLFDSLGGFDEALEVEYNDVDFCLRVRETGLHNIYVPHVELYHHESVSRGHPHSTSASYKRHIHEIGVLRERWDGYIDHDPCYNPNLTLGAHDFSIKH